MTPSAASPTPPPSTAAPDPALYRLREALFAYFAASSRAAAIGLTCPPLREAYEEGDLAEVFEAADVAPCLLRYRFHVRQGEPYGAADLLIGLPATGDAVAEALDDVARSAPSWARVAAHGVGGIVVSLPVPLMTGRGGFDEHAAELALRWFRMLADWWDRDGRALLPHATAPAHG